MSEHLTGASTTIPDLGVLDQSSATKELDLASELFHRINRIIPENQTILSVAASCPARDAIALLQKHGYSQLPVVENDEVLGVFSYRSFAKEAAREDLAHWTQQKCAPGDLRVDEFIERFEFARVTEEMNHVFNAMDGDNGILVGTPERLIGILTPMDFLRYLYRVASPFVLVSEIELSLRALIQTAMTDGQIAQAARRCLSSAYRSEDEIPTSLERMSFDNYQSIIANGDNWTILERVFGGTRTRTSAKLKELGGIRNALFHFSREITLQEHEILANHRNWLLSKIKQARTHKAEAQI